MVGFVGRLVCVGYPLKLFWLTNEEEISEMALGILSLDFPRRSKWRPTTGRPARNDSGCAKATRCQRVPCLLEPLMVRHVGL